jgi:hypothetical protein
MVFFWCYAPGTLFHRRQRGIPMHSYKNRSGIRALGVRSVSAPARVGELGLRMRNACKGDVNELPCGPRCVASPAAEPARLRWPAR